MCLTSELRWSFKRLILTMYSVLSFFRMDREWSLLAETRESSCGPLSLVRHWVSSMRVIQMSFKTFLSHQITSVYSLLDEIVK